MVLLIAGTTLLVIQSRLLLFDGALLLLQQCLQLGGIIGESCGQPVHGLWSIARDRFTVRDNLEGQSVCVIDSFRCGRMPLRLYPSSR